MSISPEHDTPIGLIHPYWARKPLNIVELIVQSLTEEEDIIIDPFMGSGTTVFAAVKKNRKVIGSDINPLASFIVSELLRISDDGIEETLVEFVSKAKKDLLPLFQIMDDRYMDRERYQVEGKYQNGNFSLKLSETVSKELLDEKWRNRKVETVPVKFRVPDPWKIYLKTPLNFSRIDLVPNSRIAIPEGAKLGHYFTNLNIICINYLLSLTEKQNYSEQQKSACKFLISSSLPLLRLSDKKASSQWPYWRPKDNLTSRNPIIILDDRLKRIKKAIVWLKENKINCSVDDLKSNSLQNSFRVKVGEAAIQDLPGFVSTKPKLILTDPPYSDHVPYLEYSAYWNNILGFNINQEHYLKEIVNSNAPSRKLDTDDYKNRLANALKICAQIVDKEGLVVWFYQDQNLDNWKKLFDVAMSFNMRIVDIIPIRKQRRSMKTVISPGRTLDGDLIVIFSCQDIRKKNGESSAFDYAQSFNDQDFYSQHISRIKDVMLQSNSIGD